MLVYKIKHQLVVVIAFLMRKMTRVSANSLSKFTKSTKKRGTNVATRAKYAPKTAGVNRELIKENALAIAAVKKIMGKPVYTDYQYSFTQQAFLTDVPGQPYQSIASNQLMSPAFWSPVLRQDANVIQSSATRVLRMQANMRYSLGESSTVQITTFVVSIRPDAVNRQINDSLIEGQDYIYAKGNPGDVDLGIVPRLNSAVFKVHYSRNVTLMSNGFIQPKASIDSGGQSVALVSNSALTMAKGQINMDLDFNIRQPVSALQWKNMQQSQLGPSQRLFLLTFFRGLTANPDDVAPRVDCDALFVAVNNP